MQRQTRLRARTSFNVRRRVAALAAPRRRAQLAGGVVAAAGLGTTLADSKHWYIGVAVLTGGAFVLALATVWVALSIAAARTAAEHGVIQGSPEAREVSLAEAARFLQTELRSIESRVKALEREGKFSRAVHPLPAQRWEEARHVLAREAPTAYDVVQEPYICADALNHVMVERANLYASRWLQFREEDSLAELQASVRRAIRQLEELVR